jgi:hypothetical protein
MSDGYNLSNSNTIPHLRICILILFTETPVLVFVFHLTLDVGRSMFNVHLFQSTLGVRDSEFQSLWPFLWEMNRNMKI